MTFGFKRSRYEKIGIRPTSYESLPSVDTPSIAVIGDLMFAISSVCRVPLRPLTFDSLLAIFAAAVDAMRHDGRMLRKNSDAKLYTYVIFDRDEFVPGAKLVEQRARAEKPCKVEGVVSSPEREADRALGDDALLDKFLFFSGDTQPLCHWDVLFLERRHLRKFLYTQLVIAYNERYLDGLERVTERVTFLGCVPNFEPQPSPDFGYATLTTSRTTRELVRLQHIISGCGEGDIELFRAMLIHLGLHQRNVSSDSATSSPPLFVVHGFDADTVFSALLFEDRMRKALAITRPPIFLRMAYTVDKRNEYVWYDVNRLYNDVVRYTTDALGDINDTDIAIPLFVTIVALSGMDYCKKSFDDVGGEVLVLSCFKALRELGLDRRGKLLTISQYEAGTVHTQYAVDINANSLYTLLAYAMQIAPTMGKRKKKYNPLEAWTVNQAKYEGLALRLMYGVNYFFNGYLHQGHFVANCMPSFACKWTTGETKKVSQTGYAHPASLQSRDVLYYTDADVRTSIAQGTWTNDVSYTDDVDRDHTMFLKRLLLPPPPTRKRARETNTNGQ